VLGELGCARRRLRSQAGQLLPAKVLSVLL
jgi:hypothetical protein